MLIDNVSLQQSLPMRHKEVHFLNLPTPLKYVYDFARNRFSQKIRSRFLVSDAVTRTRRGQPD